MIEAPTPAPARPLVTPRHILAARLRSALNAAGYTSLAAAAEVAGLHPSRLRNILTERGANITWATLGQLVERLDLDPQILLPGPQPKDATP